ncbi:unnamed protein product [Moneuplotes crassus]|uniref:Uncharacterized protein n=1 Tax=Euplotes crassus TaxID=5936 RepID=A0AAD1XQ67_EUPCR|nr:unnamed protein product [Moneuplotes crassus]
MKVYFLLALLLGTIGVMTVQAKEYDNSKPFVYQNITKMIEEIKSNFTNGNFQNVNTQASSKSTLNTQTTTTISTAATATAANPMAREEIIQKALQNMTVTPQKIIPKGMTEEQFDEALKKQRETMKNTKTSNTTRESNQSSESSTKSTKSQVSEDTLVNIKKILNLP